MQPETLNRSIQPTPTVHPRGFTPPDSNALAAVMTPRTRAVVFTHLYGARLEVSTAMALARERGVRFVEDWAEAYAGPGVLRLAGWENRDLAARSGLLLTDPVWPTTQPGQ